MHWYVGEGLDEGFFSEARENLEALILDYKDVNKGRREGDGSEEDYDSE